jgi:hypothetical protein
MRNVVMGLVVVLIFVAGAGLSFWIYRGGDPASLFSEPGRSVPDEPIVYLPRRLPAMEQAQMKVELSLVDAEYAAKKASGGKGRGVRVDR